MTEKNGHFEKGRWIEDKPGEDSKYENTNEEEMQQEEAKGGEKSENNSEETPDLDELISQTSKTVKSAVGSIIKLGNTAIRTEKGREQIEKKAKSAGEKFLKSIDEAIEEVKKSI
ncbi:hypothetical protein F1737_10855 [Methanoplanus sp. FWC-SCC4]|uniref:Uncharacterized protein n=1 Tax=Methanochimaera problematica TaxID=2609417 RepID=A0AA97I4P1_9EURY|nr:hypothetical protein [Methanoplanus sp. FWC-SCC4]WOF17141.1 hypothetical protein F1737_10855 [Methanoplanus sp. FWC-SCC4]